MSIIAFILSLFGFAASLPSTAPAAAPAAETVAVQQPDNPFFTSPRYCPLAKADCFEMVERIASGNVKVQPVLVTMDGDAPEMTQAWNTFAASLGPEFSNALLEPKLMRITAADVVKGEAFPDTIRWEAIDRRLGARDASGIPVVYWDFGAGGHFRYDAAHRVYYRSMHTILDTNAAMEEAFFAWLIHLHT